MIGSRTGHQVVRLTVPLLAAGSLMAACGSSGHGASAAPAGADVVVIKNFAFAPSTLTVPPGTTVTVHNEDPTTHTLTASGSARAFDTGDIAPGATVTFTAPQAAGPYPYICEIHQFMHGTLTVR